MNVGFKTKALERLFSNPLDSIGGKQKFSKEVIKQYKKKVIILMTLSGLDELQQYKGLRFEYLMGDLKGFCSIRLNKQFRLLFKIVEKEQRIEITIEELLITKISKHYE